MYAGFCLHWLRRRAMGMRRRRKSFFIFRVLIGLHANILNNL